MMINEESLLRLLLDINMQTEHTIFVRVYGHINLIDVAFHEGGWENNEDNYESYYFKFNEYEEIKKLYDYFEEILHRDSRLGFDKECGF